MGFDNKKSNISIGFDASAVTVMMLGFKALGFGRSLS